MEHSQTVEALQSEEIWTAVLARIEARRHLPSSRLEQYREVLRSGELARRVTLFARRQYEPDPPVLSLVNRASGRRRVVYTLATADDLMLKGISHHLEQRVADALSPLCHSYRARHGVRTAFYSLVRDPRLNELSCLHVDVSSYSSAICIPTLLSRLPPTLAEDDTLMHLLRIFLLDRRVIRAGALVEVDDKGVMQGTPLSPLLCNLYLRELDETYRQAGITYARYGDDIILFAKPAEIGEHARFIGDYLERSSLRLNKAKTWIAGPGEPWEYLGLRYQRGEIDISSHTVAKFGASFERATRQHLLQDGPGPETARNLVARLNRRLYGVAPAGHELNWAAWYFPLLTTSGTLATIDQGVQARLRLVATGSRRARAYRRFPYKDLRGLGYLPLRAAYYLFRHDRPAYRRALSERASEQPAAGWTEAG